jgi:hypothetical protein
MLLHGIRVYLLVPLLSWSRGSVLPASAPASFEIVLSLLNGSDIQKLMGRGAGIHRHTNSMEIVQAKFIFSKIRKVS